MRSIVVHLADATKQEIASLLTEFAGPNLGNEWFCRSESSSLLEISFYEDDSEVWDRRLQSLALGQEPTVSVIAHFHGGFCGGREIYSLIECLLKHHKGVVNDDLSAYPWRLTEIETGAMPHGHRFLDYQSWERESAQAPGRKEKLVSRIEEAHAHGVPVVFSSLDDFFPGNQDEGCIGVGKADDRFIGLIGYRALFLAIQKRPEVQAVFLELGRIPSFEEKPLGLLWPTVRAVHLVTSADLAQVACWVQTLEPVKLTEGWGASAKAMPPIATADLQAGMRPVRIDLL